MPAFCQRDAARGFAPCEEDWPDLRHPDQARSQDQHLVRGGASQEGGPRTWDDHGLDIPHKIETIDFKVTGTGHFRIEQIYKDCCHD